MSDGYCIFGHLYSTAYIWQLIHVFDYLDKYMIYRKALIFRRPCISRISQISLHSRNLFSTKIVSTSCDPYTSVIRTSSTQMAGAVQVVRKLPVHSRIQMVLSRIECHRNISSAIYEVSGLVQQDTGQNSSTINTTWDQYTSFPVMKSVSFSITSPSLSRR